MLLRNYAESLLHLASVERFDFEIPEPHGVAVELETKVSFTRHILVGGGELIFGSLRIFVRFSPEIQVHVDNIFAVEIYIYLIVQAGNDIVIPLAGFFYYRIRGRETVINRAALAVLCSVGGGVNLDFNGGIYPVLYTSGADEDAAVASFRDLEVELKREVAVALFCPDVTVSAGLG